MTASPPHDPRDDLSDMSPEALRDYLRGLSWPDRLAVTIREGWGGSDLARATGFSTSTVWGACKKHGIRLADKRAERAAERMRELHADPEFAAAHAATHAERMRKLHADPEVDMRPVHLRGMTATQRADYNTYRKNGFNKAAALAALGLSGGGA